METIIEISGVLDHHVEYASVEYTAVELHLHRDGNMYKVVVDVWNDGPCPRVERCDTSQTMNGTECDAAVWQLVKGEWKAINALSPLSKELVSAVYDFIMDNLDGLYAIHDNCMGTPDYMRSSDGN